MILAISLLRIRTHCNRHGLGRYQLVGKARQHPPLNVVAANGTAVVADPLAEVTETAIAVIDNDAILAATASADEQP